MLTVVEVARRLANEWRADGRSFENLDTFVRAWLDHPERGFADMPIGQLSADDVSAWGAYQRSLGRQPATVRKHYGLLSVVCAHAVDIRAVERNVVRDVPAKDRHTREADDDEAAERAALEVLTPAELSAVLYSPDVRFPIQWAVQLAALTGARLGELIELRWGDIHASAPRRTLRIDRQFNAKRGKVTATKTRRRRTVPIHPALELFLERARRYFRSAFGRWPEATDLLCVRPRKGEPVRWRPPTLLAHWRKALALVGVPDPVTGPRRFHALRHTFVTLLSDAGAPDRWIEWMTHPPRVRSTRRGRAFLGYLHRTPGAWARVCAALDMFPLDEAMRRRLEAESGPLLVPDWVADVARAVPSNPPPAEPEAGRFNRRMRRAARVAKEPRERGPRERASTAVTREEAGRHASAVYSALRRLAILDALPATSRELAERGLFARGGNANTTLAKLADEGLVVRTPGPRAALYTRSTRGDVVLAELRRSFGGEST